MSILAVVLLSLSPTLAPESENFPTPTEQVWLDTIAKEFATAVGIYRPPESYRAWALTEAEKLMAISEPQGCPQLFVFADRNPKVQLDFIGCYGGSGKVYDLGWNKVSTGDPRHGGDYHFTPTGIFANSVENFSYRAAGTKNHYGYRGYGVKGMRVWDFGWQWTTKPVRGGIELREIRLLMHATDPDCGEPKLGSIQSKGCVRISHAFNKFVEHYGVLDRPYIDLLPEPRIVAILPKDRVATGLEGKFLLIADSAVADFIK